MRGERRGSAKHGAARCFQIVLLLLWTDGAGVRSTERRAAFPLHWLLTMAKKELKTNAMRLLDRLRIPYEHREYDCGEFTDGAAVAEKLGLPAEEVFKTLVAAGSDRQHYVFVIPVAEELDLKKCARSVGVKSVELIHVKDLLPLTGYVRGGCTAVGMKKKFETRIDESASRFPRIYVSGGRIGSQICLAPEDLLRAAEAQFADLTR